MGQIGLTETGGAIQAPQDSVDEEMISYLLSGLPVAIWYQQQVDNCVNSK